MNASSPIPAERMAEYLRKIATGPTMSKDLTRAEADDGLTLVLDGAVSPVRAGLFLIAARMKRETLEENLGYWQALDRTTEKRRVALDRLLVLADAFDGFERIPYFGFYVMPLLAQMGLPACGHSTLPLPPKFGITFEDLLVNHYGVAADLAYDRRVALLEKFEFGYFGTRQTHPKLEALRDLRVEIVKRPMLATFEKMLMPLEAQHTFLATNYFHPGYEEPMLAAARESGYETVILGNGMEGTTLYGVHKRAKLFIHRAGQPAQETMEFDYETIYDNATAEAIRAAFETLKSTETSRETLAALGEQALRDGTGPAAPLLAHQAATLCVLVRHTPNFQDTWTAAMQLLHSGACRKQWDAYLTACRE